MNKKYNDTIVCNVISMTIEKEENNKGENTKVVNSGAYELGGLGVTIDASAGNLDIDPNKGTISYIVNGTKKTLKPDSEEFKNSIKARREKIAKEDVR